MVGNLLLFGNRIMWGPVFYRLLKYFSEENTP